MSARQAGAWMLSILCASACAQLEAASSKENDCLYATTSGGRAIPGAGCQDSDPLDLARDPAVLTAMRAYGIPAGLVRFKGCQDLPFSVTPDVPGPRGGYVVNYPANAGGRTLAPVVHELAHVRQMEDFGGLSALLQRFHVKRIELDADHMAGAVFATQFPSLPLREFEQNLLLMGAYREIGEDGHGSPEERIAAFRTGVFLTPAKLAQDLSRISNDFMRDGYGQVVSATH